MKSLSSLLVPILMLSIWFCIALATMVKLTGMSMTLSDMERAEQARQAQAQAPRLASTTPKTTAE